MRTMLSTTGVVGIVLCVSVIGCTLGTPQLGEGVDRFKSVGDQSFSDWLDAEIPEGTSVEDAVQALAEVGITCDVSDKHIRCDFFELDESSGSLPWMSLTMEIADGKIAKRTVSCHGGII